MPFPERVRIESTGKVGPGETTVTNLDTGEEVGAWREIDIKLAVGAAPIISVEAASSISASTDYRVFSDELYVTGIAEVSRLHWMPENDKRDFREIEPVTNDEMKMLVANIQAVVGDDDSAENALNNVKRFLDKHHIFRER